MKGIKVGISPITNTIYAGKVNKASTMWVGEKVDVNEDAVMCVAQKLLKADESFVFNMPDGDYKLTVIKIED